MLFNSVHFLLFFPLVTAAYFLLPHRSRRFLLLAASYYFYAAWKLEYVPLLLLSTAVDYVAARKIEGAGRPAARKMFLWLSLSCNLGILFWFKYAAFATESIGLALSPLGVVLGIPVHSLLLPMGISFYTFQTLSYTIDVYRGDIPAERSFWNFALYVSFFPQLVAGPIERAKRLLPQFERVQVLDLHRVREGATLMAWGFFQKLVIADRVAVYVDAVFNDPSSAGSGGTVLIAMYLFAFQIYADFAGYTSIAIGSARVLGFRLQPNFRQPYLAQSMSELWTRWHISLTAWFRDYLYMELRDRRRRDLGHWARNTLIVFVVMGAWHGAAWHFVVFGLVTACILVAGRVLRPLRNRAWEAITSAAGAAGGAGVRTVGRVRVFSAWFVTFHLAVLVLLFFRANTLRDAWLLLGTLTTNFSFAGAMIPVPSVFEMVIGLAGIAALSVNDVLHRIRSPLIERVTSRRWARWTLLYAVAAATLMFGELRTTEFVYFQF